MGTNLTHQSTEPIDTESQNIDKIKDDSYYFNIMDPKTGKRYNIPLLEKTGSYYQDYVHYMKIKETSPNRATCRFLQTTNNLS